MNDKMKLYAWRSPNCYKVLIFVHEIDVPIDIVPVNIRAGEQNDDTYRAINPNGKVPVLMDSTDGKESMLLAESGAILIYLADKYSRYLQPSGLERYMAIQWLMFQMSAIAPSFGQAAHFMNLETPIPYATKRYMDETRRLYMVLDNQLSKSSYLAGDYSIADMAMFPWVRHPGYFDLKPDELPNVTRWIESVGSRPAVERAMAISFPLSS